MHTFAEQNLLKINSLAFSAFAKSSSIWFGKERLKKSKVCIGDALLTKTTSAEAIPFLKSFREAVGFGYLKIGWFSIRFADGDNLRTPKIEFLFFNIPV